MESDATAIRVAAPLPHIQFLSIDNAGCLPLLEEDRNRLLSIVRYDSTAPVPGEPGTIWRTPLPRPSTPPLLSSEAVGLEFGGASEVFHSLTAGLFDPTVPLHQPLVPALAEEQEQRVLTPPNARLSNSDHLSHPPPLPGAAQHIHINNFTANLNYHAAAAAAGAGLLPPPNLAMPILPNISRPSEMGGGSGGQAGPSQPQPVPFVGAHFPPGSYVAPFPPPNAASPPMYPPALPPPYHQLVMLPPGPALHFSMFPPSGATYHHSLPTASVPTTAAVATSYTAGQPPSLSSHQPAREHTSSSNNNNIMFGSTTVVSMKHLSSDDESADEARRTKSDAKSLKIEEEEDEAEDDEDKARTDEQQDIVLSHRREEVTPCRSKAIEPPAARESQEGECEEIARLSRQHLQRQEDLALASRLDGGPSHPRLSSDTKGQDEVVSIELPIATGPRPTPPPFPHLKPVTIKVVSPKPTAAVTSSGTEDSRQDVAQPHQQQHAGSKSWASLFSPPNPSVERIHSEKPTARIPPFSAKSDDDLCTFVQAPAASLSGFVAGGNVAEDDLVLGELLRSCQLNHVAPALLPRGLSNRSNWCFANAILQALLACPPFYNLFKALPAVPVGLRGGGRRRSINTPMLNAIVEFVNEFSPLEAMNKSQKKDRGRKREDLPMGTPLEPSYVYRALLELETETFRVEEGRQEDAEEFLTCLLNILSDEMHGLIKMVAANPAAGSDEQEAISSADSGEWVEMGLRGRSCMTRRAWQPHVPVTPIQKLASGLCRSSVRCNTETSSTLQPFFALQLDIQSPTVHSVTEALLENFSSEQLEGINSSCQQQQLSSRVLTVSLEELPPVLILHLKRMLFDGSTGGCVKVMKWVDFSVDLEIRREMLSQSSKTKYTLKQRQYKLFAVIYHNGREATKGHYVTDVYHTGYGCWLRCDDSVVRPIPEQTVTTPTPGSVPYILLYRRCDTMVGMNKSAK